MKENKKKKDHLLRRAHWYLVKIVKMTFKMQFSKAREKFFFWRSAYWISLETIFNDIQAQ